MKQIHSFRYHQALLAVNEAIEEFIQQATDVEASQITDLVNSQDEIFQKYSLSSTEIGQLKNSMENSIKVKMGIGF